MTTNEKIKNLFTKNQKLIWNYIYAREIVVFSKEFSCFFIQNGTLFNSALSFIITAIKKRTESINKLEEAHKKFLSAYPVEEQKIKNYLRKYFRYLDKFQGKKSWHWGGKYRWLDKKALEEKYYTCVVSVKKEISALFNLAPAFLNNTNAEIPNEMFLSEMVRISIELLNTEPIWQLKQAVLFFMKQICSDYSQQLNNELTENLVLNTYKIALNKNENCWVRSCAMEILSILSEKQFVESAKGILSEQSKDSIFLKGRLVKILTNGKAVLHIQILDTMISDSSEFVKQSIAENLPLMPQEHCFRFLNILTNDKKTSVVCQTIKSSFIILLKNDNAKLLEMLTTKLLLGEDKDCTLFLINSFSQYFKELNKKDRSEFLFRLKTVVPVLEQLRQDSDHLEVRRNSALVLEQLWCEYNEQAFKLKNYILQKLEAKKPGGYIKLDWEILSRYDDETIGRILAVISQEDFSIQLIKRFFTIKLVKDAFYKFRLWRIFFEFRSPSPHKRQALKNSYGRHFLSRTRSASSIMAEKSETRIPGEPVLLKEEGCRPYLPLPDDVLSALEASSVYKVFSPEGITKIKPPRNILKKLATETKIIFSFEKLAEKRNIDTVGETEFQVKEYISTLRKAGYEISIIPYKKDEMFSPKPDSTVNRFFSLPLIFPSQSLKIFEDMKTYFFSLYLNTISQLLFFASMFIGFFIVKHITIHSLFKKARKSISLIIGGWGTRGKSSTERLKAAIFSSLGCSILSKTTGCEAVFLYSAPFDQLQEYPIFRPYEKVTIWEQYTLVRMGMASRLNIDVFLWECMAISPHYVKLMQRNWMKDDFSTITNTYPDHEDIQGPAGWNIAESMTNFIPEKSVLFTTEDQMYPILKNSAAKLNTQFFRVTPMDIMLIPEEVISRFSYSEHPNNVALVTALAERLEIEKDYALKEMCDNVVPDIGVLKKFRPLKINTKTLEFISGMSANEKYACLQNWTRMKMDSFDTEKDYGTIISTVVNNRADRVSRSRVFAQIIAEELSADYHFLVGTNLEGISGYIKKVWRSSLKSFSHATEEEVVELFERKATFLRIPSKETILKNKLKLIMTSNSEIKSLEASEAYKKMVQTYNEYIELKKELSSSLLPINKLAEKCKKLLTHWFYDKIIMLHNPKINGEEIIKHIEAKTPPYHKNIIMGIQNIKGPGINLINTWKRLESSASDIQLKTPNSQQCPVNFIGKGALKCYSMAKTLIEPFSSIAKQRNAKSIYKAIVSGTISSFKAIKELKKLRD